MVRFSYLFSKNPDLMSLIVIVGGVTSLFSGLSAIFEFDVKKAIALSTLSQLGFMLVSLGVGLFRLSFFHIITHAVLKALLLICGGIIIHLIGHSQDVRGIGMILTKMPVTCRAIRISCLSIGALPFIAGLLSKDAILEAIFFSRAISVALIASSISAVFT